MSNGLSDEELKNIETHKAIEEFLRIQRDPLNEKVVTLIVVATAYSMANLCHQLKGRYAPSVDGDILASDVEVWIESYLDFLREDDMGLKVALESLSSVQVDAFHSQTDNFARLALLLIRIFSGDDE